MKWICHSLLVVLLLSAGCVSAMGDSSSRGWVCGKVIFSGDCAASLQVNEPFAQSVVDDAVSRFMKQLQDSGYYYAQAVVSSLSSRHDTIDVVVTVRRGPLVTVGDIVCVGLVRNSDRTVRRYLRIPPGAPLTPELMATVEARSRQIPFATYQPSVVILPRPGYSRADLQIRFREPSAVALAGTGGYRADDNNGLIWSLDGALRDVLGDGRQVRVKSERRDKSHKSLAIEYQQPVFLLGRSQFEVGLQTRDYRDQFSQFTVTLGLTSLIGDRSWLGSTLAWSRVDPAGNFGGYSKYQAEIRYRFTSVRDTVNPVAGLTLGWSAAYQYRSYRAGLDSGGYVPSSLNETRSRLKVQQFESIGSPRLIAAAGVDLMFFTTPQSAPPLAELFLLGGPGTIRGYRTDQFSARRAAIGTGEFRWRGESGYLFLFCDIAYIDQPVSGGGDDEFSKVGYGAGFKLIDRDRSVTFALGWNPDLKLSRPQVLLNVATGL